MKIQLLPISFVISYILLAYQAHAEPDVTPTPASINYNQASNPAFSTFLSKLESVTRLYSSLTTRRDVERIMGVAFGKVSDRSSGLYQEVDYHNEYKGAGGPIYLSFVEKTDRLGRVTTAFQVILGKLDSGSQSCFRADDVAPWISAKDGWAGSEIYQTGVNWHLLSHRKGIAVDVGTNGGGLAEQPPSPSFGGVSSPPTITSVQQVQRCMKYFTIGNAEREYPGIRVVVLSKEAR